ncbi:BMP family lipoprotein [Risungbinella massiliensis]|uniref:BMP family lipoprotein n=1 Tax=Risungbinella massiliensis TaxID=1329796 RepID=UPI00069C6DD7|nr:BMP family ABC transporter substrate-binding protein [Risungbinella massiliensis]
MRSWKKWTGAIVAISLIGTACANANNNENQTTNQGNGGKDTFQIGMVTNVGGINDQSFNEITWTGLTRAGKELPADVKYLESKREDDYVPNLTRFAREKRDLIWGVGFKFEKALPEVAKRFPEQTFGVVDTNLNNQVPKNVAAITFREEEGSYLMGVMAGLTTKTNKVGFVGGISSPLIKRFEVGYRAGVKAVNPKATVQVAYTESFTDATKARSIASNMYNGGADVIYHAAGGAGKGVFDEAKTRDVGKYFVIGADLDQSNLAPNHTLSSMVKRLDKAVYDFSKQVKDRTATLGTVTDLGLKEDGIAYPYSKYVTPEVKAKVEEYKQKIVQGQIKVPKTEAELK